MLNLVNCTLDCDALNREPCLVDGLCGGCLDGFVGATAPSRQACWTSRRRTTTCANGVLDKNETETDLDCGGQCAPCAVGAACEEDSDCAYGWCNHAASGLGICGVPTKLCVANCSGHGACEYSDITGAHLAARDCTIDRWSCDATCLCDPGFYGDACSLDTVAYEGIASLRSSLIGSLEIASSMQDATADAMDMQASSLSSLTAKPAELRGTAVQATALGLATDIAETSGSIGLAWGTAASVGISLSQLCDTALVKRMNNTANTSTPSATPTMATTSEARLGSVGDGSTGNSAGVTSMLRATSLLSTAQLANNVAGEDPISVDTKNIMMNSQRSYARSASTGVLSVPVNGDGNAPAVMLGAAALAYDENGSALEAPYAVVDTQWQQWGVNILPSDIVTTSALVSLYVVPDVEADDAIIETDDGSRRRLSETIGDDDDATDKRPELRFVLQTLVATDYSLQSDSALVNLSCAAGFIGRARKRCPLTNATISTNCTGKAVDVQLACATKGVPTCLRWDPWLQAYESDSCAVRNFSKMNITCGCDPGTIVAPALEGGSHFTSGSEQLLLFFVSTFNPPGGYGLSLFTQNALLMYTFGFLFIYALVSFLFGQRADARDRKKWEIAKATTGSDTSTDLVWTFAYSSLPPFMRDHSAGHTAVKALMMNHPCVCSRRNLWPLCL